MRSIIQYIPSLSAGQAWAAVSTEGLVVYTLDSGIVFDPLDLSIDVTPETVIDAIKSHDLLTAIVLSFKLGDRKLLQKSVETVAPYDGMYVVPAHSHFKHTSLGIASHQALSLPRQFVLLCVTVIV